MEERSDELLISQELCRFCQCSTPIIGMKACTDNKLISPCSCNGSLKYVHIGCLNRWVRVSNNKNCEVCQVPYKVSRSFKPVCYWECLPLSNTDKKRIVFSAAFHTVAITCVFWSLYVLIDRTVEEYDREELEWQFWTKIIVESIGCIGALVLLFVWGKTYVILFLKWINFNKQINLDNLY